MRIYDIGMQHSANWKQNFYIEMHNSDIEICIYDIGMSDYDIGHA